MMRKRWFVVGVAAAAAAAFVAPPLAHADDDKIWPS
jgi:H+/Cl- antiporter ClcA